MTDDKQIFREWGEALEDEYGWYKASELRELLNEVNKKKVDTTQDDLTRLAEFVNSQDEIPIKIRKTLNNQRVRYFIKSDLESRFEKLKSELPEKSHSAFDELIGSGKSPSVVAATIHYLTDSKDTKKDSTDKFDVSPAAITQNQEKVAEKLGVSPSIDKVSKPELYQMIAAEVGFDYDASKSNNYFKSSHLRKILDQLQSEK